MSRTLLPGSAVLLLWAHFAYAHHSFAAYYGPSEPQGLITLEGTVSEFRYTNPHGLLFLNVQDERWTIETLAPNMLSRMGWSATSLRHGEHVRVQGWRARDGSRLMRLQSVTREDGTTLGGPGAARPAGK